MIGQLHRRLREEIARGSEAARVIQRVVMNLPINASRRLLADVRAAARLGNPEQLAAQLFIRAARTRGIEVGIDEATAAARLALRLLETTR